MPIPVIAMLAVGLLSVLWPAPKLDHVPPPSGGVFAPQITTDNRPRTADVQTFEASVTVPVK